MELQHVNVKILVDDQGDVDLTRFIQVFHAWVRDQILDELLIDVADYRHVPEGPGVMLIGLEADYNMDSAGGRLGLRYNRKAPLSSSNADRFSQALASAARVCHLLEEHFEGEDAIKFSRQEFELFINDRALAPNTSETLAACQPEIEAFLKTALGHDQFTLEHHADPRSRFGVTIKTAKPFDLASLHVANNS